MKKLYVVLLCFMPILVFGQIKFNRSYDIKFGWDFWFPLAGGVTIDTNLFGGYICHTTTRDNSTAYQIVINYDSLGNIIDTSQLHSLNENLLSPTCSQLYFNPIDSSYFGGANTILLDSTTWAGYRTEPILVKLKYNGDTIWTRRINTYNNSIFLNCIYPLTDGFLFAGSFSLDTIFWNYSYLMKVDTNGFLLWDRMYGDSNSYEFATNVIKAQSGHFELSSFRQVANVDSFITQVYMLDTFGNVLAKRQWADSSYNVGKRFDNSFSILNRNIPSSVRPDCYVGYFFLDSTKSTPSGLVDFIYVRLRGLDSNFNTVWSRSIKRNDYYTVEHISLLNNSDLIITGSIGNPVTNNLEGWVVVMDSYGIVKWERRYNKFNNTVNWLVHSKQTTDGGYILVGYTGSSHGNAENWLIKVDSLGCEDWSALGCSPVSVTKYSNHDGVITVYPNPTSGILHIEFTPNLIGTKMKFELRDIVGKVVFQQVLSTSSSKCITALPFTLPDGNYTAHCIAENGFVYTTKVSMQK